MKLGRSSFSSKPHPGVNRGRFIHSRQKASERRTATASNPPVPRNPTDVWILLSGGIDSSACIEFYKSQGLELTAFFVDYGQLAARAELAAARRISAHYKVPLRQGHWLSSRSSGPGLIQGRNALLIFATLLERGESPGLIALGIHAGTAYYDCSPRFLRNLQSVVASYTDGRVRLAAPFVRWNKRTVLEFCRSRNVPLRLTYSCELGRAKPCNECLSCQDRKVLCVV